MSTNSENENKPKEENLEDIKNNDEESDSESNPTLEIKDVPKEETDTNTSLDENPNPSDTILELQLGDVIHITNPVNDELNDHTFIIDYIDKAKAFLINTESMNRIRLSISPEGTIGDGNITRIAILSRSDSPSYARQNELLPGKWINIYFGGEFPVIISGEITNLENDMIEIKTIDGDVIYLNFDYKGIPENLPIEMIEIREKPSEPLTEAAASEEEEIAHLDEIPELQMEQKFVEPETLRLSVPVKDIKDQLREFIIRADQVKFGDEEFGPIVQYVDVTSKSQRYSIETQVSDLLDELLSTIPNAQRTPRVLNNIHIMIDRFKQLREHFSYFDQYGNVESALVKEATYKPLSEYFSNFKVNLYWILPVVKNIKKVYNVNSVDDENNDIIDLDLDRDVINIDSLIENYKSNDLPGDHNKYASLYAELNPYFTPFESAGDEKNAGIVGEKAVLADINTIVDNLEEMYSSIFNSNSIRNRRFVIQKYNTSLTKLDTVDSTGAKLITIRTNISNNDEMSIKSFLTLPEPIMRFSKINLPGTNILDKANLNLTFLNYWQLLKKKTNVNNIFIDSFEKELEFNEQNFANNIKNFVLNLNEDEDKGVNKIDIYNQFVKALIPKTKILFNLMKKYIVGKLSIVDVVSYLEPFLIYTDDLTFMQYKEIVEFIDGQISKYNKEFVEKSRIFKQIGQLSARQQLIPSKAFSIIDILNKNLRNEVIAEGYDMYNPETTFTNSEIIRKMMIRDYMKLYTAALSVQSFPLMFPSEFSNLFEEEKKKLDDKLKKEVADDKCKPTIIAKYYTSLEQMNADNDKTIYFDKKYDKTNYGILEEVYGKEVMSMSPEELRAHIVKDFMQKKKFTESEAEYQANTLIDGLKRVVEGQYAVLYKGYNENSAEEVDFYVRKNNKWELDPELNKEKINSDESTILCDIQKQCISVTGNNDDKCETIKENELGLQTLLLKNVISEFDAKYKMSKEEYQRSVTDKFNYLKSIIAVLTKLETTNMLKYNNQKYKLGAGSEDDKNIRPISPYQELLNLILSQKDFVKKQNDIIKFVNTYTRKGLPGLGPLSELETPHWLYCIKTHVPILPSFKYDLAESFVVEGQYGYLEYLEIVKSKIGKQSDDGDWWCDEHSGWPICPTNFDFEEGYEEGFKVSTRAIMEEDAGNKIVSAAAERELKYTTPDTIMINNIINALSVAMGINIEPQKEFVMNCVLDSIRNTVESESDYKQMIREMAEKGKKMMSYKDFYNTSLLYYTLGAFLIAVQTAIPSVKTRKTHPGCVRSFTGYPFEGTGDFSSVTYLGCVAYDIRESGEPWNVLKGKKQEAIINKIKSVINDVLLPLPDVKRKFEEKTEYLLTNPSTEIPEDHDIAKWTQFLPPLMNFKIKQLANISPEFKKSLMSDLRAGTINQREKLMVIDSKIIQFSLAIVEKIQEIVKKNRLLLHSSGNEPYLENACCDSNENETTVNYFISRDSRIAEYNNIVTQLSNMMEDINSYSEAGIFYSNLNTKNKYPSINNEFNEKTIYLAFIYFCKFKSLIPISEDLLPICTNKPEATLINPNDSLDRIIQKLKDDGRNYTNEQFLRLLQIISQHNIINVQLDKPEISCITKLVKIIETIDYENDEVLDKSLRDLITKTMDSFDIATENYTKEIKDLNNFLIRNIDSMKEEIIDFIQKNKGSNITNSLVRKMTKTLTQLSNWSADNSNRNENIRISDDKLYNIVNFYKNFIDNFVNVFPNIILNKVNYDNIHIPNYYGFSKNHSSKIKKFISGYYEKLKPFYGTPTLQNVLITIQRSAKNLVKIANATPSFTSIRISNERSIKPIFDERTSRFLFEYYLLKVLISYIDLSDEMEMVTTEVQKKTEITDIFTVEYLEETETKIDLSTTSRNETDTRILTGNKKQLRQNTAQLLLAFIEMMDNEKEVIDISYEEIQDRVFKLREKEKDLVTDRLKKMTDEQRDADTILKINKLGMYSKGMQKGLTTLDKDFYDEEQTFRDKMTQAERNIRRKNVDANDENIDILLNEYIEQQDVEAEIEAEVYDMEYMNEGYLDGNTDGVGAPEEEYDDYQEDY
jgi:hypothetical protein